MVRVKPSHAEYFYMYNTTSINLQHRDCKHIFSIRVENSVDPDQIASSETS